MTDYRVTAGDTVWAECSDREEAQEAFDTAMERYPEKLVVLTYYYAPPKPVGHWIIGEVARGGKVLHDALDKLP